MIRKFTRFSCLLLSLLFVAFASTASARSLEEIISAGVIKVGVNPNYPPIALYNDKNELDGYDVDISRKIAEMLGVKLELVVVNPNDRIPFVASDKIDYVMGALTRTTDRAKVVDFTVPEHTEALGVLTLGDKGFQSWQDLNAENVTLAEVRGTTPVEFIRKNLPKAKLLLLDSHPDIVRAVAQGRADAIIEVVDFLGESMKQHDVDWKILSEPAGEIYYCAIGVAKGNDSLRHWLNVALFDLIQSGYTDEVWAKWFGVPMAFKVPAQPFF